MGKIKLVGLFVASGIVALISYVHAQTTTISIQSLHSASTDDRAVILQAVEATPPLPAESVPKNGNGFYSAQNPNWPPLPGNINNLPVWDLGGGSWLLADQDFDYAALEQQNTATHMLARAMGLEMDSQDFSGSSYTIDTNGLWLEITGVSNGQAYLNLHNATNEVYEIWSKTDLLVPGWNIEQEVWPGTNLDIMPVTVPQLDRANLFIWARDWTGIDENSNDIPDWWEWKYFGNFNQTADGDYDGDGINNWQEYQWGTDPNKIWFAVQFTNTLFNSNLLQGTITISGGVPSYWAVLINDDNADDANWQPYTSSNLQVNLNAGDGNYAVWVGLRGLPADAHQTWLERPITLDTTPPVLTVTNPTNGLVSQPMIQLQGYANESLSRLTFDVSNVLSVLTNQPGYVTGQFYDTNLLAFTTNWFQCYDIALTNGLNTITLHATDLAGNLTTADYSFTLDYTNDTTPPTLTLIWPQDGTVISGSQFTLQAQVDDPTATVTASIVDADGNSNNVSGVVERSGQVWVNNLPVAAGANTLTLTATDAAGNTFTTNLVLIQSSVTVTLNPLSGNQLNQPFVSVTGTVSDPSCTVTVNGVSATVNSDGTWSADNVPVSPAGMATFDVEVYAGEQTSLARANLRFTPLDASPGANTAGSQWFNQPQPVMVILSAYSVTEHTEGPGWWENYTIKWAYDSGGNWSEKGASYGSYGPDIAQPRGGIRPMNESQWSYSGGGGGIWPDGAGFTPPLAENEFEEEVPFTPAWENAAVTAPVQRSIQTTAMLMPSRLTVAGATQLYLVTAKALELSNPATQYIDEFLSGGYAGDVPLPPEWLQINGQTLVNSGITNDDGSVWGETIISGSAGQPLPLTMTATRVHLYNDYTFTNQAFEVNLQLAVDANRDGNITFDAADQTTTDTPYRFWVNDSKEHGDVTSGSDTVPGQSASAANYSLNHVNGRCDLINFFPVALCLSNVMQWLPPTNGWEYHLSQADSAV